MPEGAKSRARSNWRVCLAALALFVALPAAAGGGASAVGVADWPQFRFDAAHSGFNPNGSTLGPRNVPLAEVWTTARGEAEFEVAVAGPSGPILLNGSVHASAAGGLTAYGLTPGYTAAPDPHTLRPDPSLKASGSREPIPPRGGQGR